MNGDDVRNRDLRMKDRVYRWGIGVCILFALMCVILGFVFGFMGYQTPSQGPERLRDLSDFGSYLQGTTASFWSLAGFFIICVAFLAQKQQLFVQQIQFERQSFENSFFQLLNLHNEIASAVRDVEAGATDLREVRGRDCFQKWYEQFKTGWWGVKINTDDWGTLTSVDGPKSLSKRYLAFYTHYQGMLGHYFRNLYHLIKFIKSSNSEDKRRYTSLARAQLSQYELALLFYNGIAAIPPETENKFKPLIEEFGLLKNLDPKLLLNPDEDLKLYDPKAFK